MRKYTLSVILLFKLLIISGQVLPPARHFSPDIYNAGSQNWSIAQDSNKHIYIANNSGLLVYDGARWKLHDAPNQTIIRSVQVIGDRIYSGSYMEFGYWTKNESGQLAYTSVSRQISDRLVEDEEFWKIAALEDRIAFQSLKQIYLYNPKDETFEVIPSDNPILKMFAYNDELFFQQEGAGLFRFSNGSIAQILSNEDLYADEIIEMLPAQTGAIFVMRENGILRWNGTDLIKIPFQDPELKELSVYSAIQLRDGSFLLGTISNGLYVLSPDLSVLRHRDRSSGLGNNTVLSLFEDVNNNIWAGLDNGITSINSNSAIRMYTDESGRLGTVYTSALYEGMLYLGTNQGLFARALRDQGPFKLVAGTEGQVWDLQVLGKQLFCGHHKGTLIVSGLQAYQIPRTRGTWRILSLDMDQGLLLQGNYDGLYVLQKSNSGWQVRNRIEGFDNSARHVEFLENQIFVNHEYKGLFSLTVDNNFQRILKKEVQEGLTGKNSGLLNYKDNIHYLSPDGIYTFDPALQRFEINEALSSLLPTEEYVSGTAALNRDKDACWIFRKSGITYFKEISSDSIYQKTIPLSVGTRNDREEYENILQIDSSQFLLGRTDGFMLVDLNKFTIPRIEVQVSSYSVARLPKSWKTLNLDRRAFAHEENSFRFSFNTPAYLTLFQPKYQTRLVGLYDDWSSWSTNAAVSFENLPPGNYEFQVRARIGEKISTNTFSHRFYIRKPWYQTNVMIVVYILAVVFLTLLTHKLYQRYYRKQQAQIIEQNLQQLEYERMKNEQEIIKLRNEQLQTSYEAKSKELATSLMNIVNKNELLNQIKDQLLRLRDQEGLSAVIKTIDQNLNQKKNWELFKEAFDNADSEFFKNLKEKHPKLSPNDLKLCAYLRLNLSSKEIAPLINISPRSVEIKRYRLRKKLNLDNNENLVSYIMEI